MQVQTRIGFAALLALAAFALNSTDAAGLSGTSVGIQAWVKDPSRESCLTTPNGQIVNGCQVVVELDLPVYAVHYKQATLAGAWVKWDGNGSKPACQVISVDDVGSLVAATAVTYAATSAWTEITGNVTKSAGGAFIACWLNPGDSLSSYWWEPGYQ